jgi:hypothetical protein
MAPCAALKVLSSRSLRWSSPDTFNDPFDMGFPLHVDIDHVSVRRRTLKSLWDACYSPKEIPVGNDIGRKIQDRKATFAKVSRREFNLRFGRAIDKTLQKIPFLVDESDADFQRAMKDTKVLCLTERRDSILMWSHYAQMHQGVVFELGCVPHRDSAWGAAMPVKYGDMPPMYNDDFLIRVLSGQATMNTSKFTNELIKGFVTAKAADWSYEREWRVVLHFRDPNQRAEYLAFSPDELAAVYLGCRMSHNHEEEIVAKIRRDYSGTKIFVAEKMEQKFALRFRDY